MPDPSRGLTVAVTGPTGTFGHGLMPLLEADDRIQRVVGIARRPCDPAEHGWKRMTYRQGDVRDREALTDSFRSADVVVHLAFLITGTAGAETTRQVNVDGTLNAFRAACDAGARRFVYASSVAAYGFFPDNPVGMTEDWPTRPATRLFYAQEKAELEGRLVEEAARHPQIDLFLLRPPIVLGPHAMGAKDLVPGLLRPVAEAMGRMVSHVPSIPVFVPNFPLQFIHEDDVGQAFLQCIVGAGPPGAYNIAGDGVLTAQDVARELGLRVLPFPSGLVRGLARAIMLMPLPRGFPPVIGWIEAITYPSIVDTTRATSELGWHPTYSGLEALRVTLSGTVSAGG